MKRREYHGRTKHPLYNVWRSMIQRCTNPKNRCYANYGGRGITVCDEWRESFAAFHADMGDCPAGHSIERVDNDGPYSPENCKWATRSEQSMNRRFGGSHTHNGVTMTLRQWALHVGLKYETLHKRIAYRGWTFEEAITAPKGKPWGHRRLPSPAP